MAADRSPAMNRSPAGAGLLLFWGAFRDRAAGGSTSGEYQTAGVSEFERLACRADGERGRSRPGWSSRSWSPVTIARAPAARASATRQSSVGSRGTRAGSRGSRGWMRARDHAHRPLRVDQSRGRARVGADDARQQCAGVDDESRHASRRASCAALTPRAMASSSERPKRDRMRRTALIPSLRCARSSSSSRSGLPGSSARERNTELRERRGCRHRARSGLRRPSLIAA